MLPKRAGDDPALFPSSAGLAALATLLSEIRVHLGEKAFLRLDHTEMMASHYPIGGFYAPHVDRFHGSSERFFTFVYFLNPEWLPAHGGELHIISPQSLTIEPLMGRLVLFHTPEVMHEVLKSLKSRFAVTGWLGRAGVAPLVV